MSSSRRGLTAWALAFALVGASPVQAQDIHPDHGVRRLKGTAVAIDSKAPIRDASIVVDGRPVTVTDANGAFLVEGLPARPIRLIVRAIGFVAVSEAVDLTSTDAEVVVRLRSRPFALDSLVVTGKATDAEIELHDRQATSRLDADDIARTRGQTLGETLEQVPGVAVIQYGPSIAKPVVRGLHSQRIAVMNGAVPQQGQQWGAEHAPEIDAFAANDIEVIRGAAGVLYGSDAIGGVVRVLPRPLPTAGAISGELQVNLFANNRQGATSLQLEGAGLDLPGLGPTSWRLQGTYRRAGDARASAYYLPNTGFEEIDWSGALGIRRRWGSSELGYSHFGTNLGMYSGAHVGNLTDLERAMSDPIVGDEFSYRIRRPDQTVAHDLISWQNKFRLNSGLQLGVDYGYQYNDRNEYDSHGFAASNPRPAFGLRLITHSVDVRLSHAPVGGFAGTFGVTGMRQGNLSPGRSFLIPQYRLYTAGFFGLEQWTRGGLSASVGLRYDYRWQRAYQFGAPVVISPEDTTSYDGLSGTLGLSYQLAPGWSVSATAGRMWRAPNVNERFSQGVHHGTAQYEIGDRELGIERTFSLDATLRHVGTRGRLEVSAYRNAIDDYIFLRPRAPIQTVRGAYPAYVYTATDARLQGVEISGQLDPIDQLSFYASGTAVRGIERQGGTPLFDMPADRMVLSARLYGPRGRRAVTDPYLEVGTTLVRRQDRVPSTTVYRLPTDGYALLNVELGARHVALFGQAFEISLSARNLLDARYRDYLSRYRLYVDDTGRDVVFRLRTPFGHPRS